MLVCSKILLSSTLWFGFVARTTNFPQRFAYAFEVERIWVYGNKSAKTYECDAIKMLC